MHLWQRALGALLGVLVGPVITISLGGGAVGALELGLGALVGLVVGVVLATSIARRAERHQEARGR